MTDAEFLSRHPEVGSERLAAWRVRVFYRMYDCIDRQNPMLCNNELFLRALAASLEPIQNDKLAAKHILGELPSSDLAAIDKALRRACPDRVRAWTRRARDRNEAKRNRKAGVGHDAPEEAGQEPRDETALP